jgi:hypothetical protein
MEGRRKREREGIVRENWNRKGISQEKPEVCDKKDTKLELGRMR